MTRAVILFCIVVGVACANRGGAKVLITQTESTEEREEQGFDRVVTSCGHYLGTPAFEGRLVYRDGFGQSRPMQEATFWRGVGEASIRDGTLRRVAINLSRRGTFEHPVTIATSETSWYRGGGLAKWEDWVEDVVFVIRADGCQDAVVHFHQEWRPREIEMTCSAHISDERAHEYK